MPTAQPLTSNVPSRAARPTRRPSRLLLWLAGALVLASALHAAASASQRRSAPRRFALVIGIKGYPNFPDDKKLRFADDDARMFADFIQTPVGGSFPRDNIRLLTNAEATYERIYDEIDWLAQNVRGDSVAYFFFAGHGVVGESGRAYFMPYGGRPTNPAGTGIRADTLLQDFSERVNARHMIFFIDACHAGAALRGGGAARDDEVNVTAELNRLWAGEFARRDRTEMGFFSARPNQKSFEDEELRHGLFTYHLVRGMQGAADIDNGGDGKVSAAELQRYVAREVEARSRMKFQLQTPIVSTEFDSDLALAFRPAPTPRPTATPAPGPVAPEPQRQACERSDGRNLTVVALDEEGRGVSDAEVALIFSDGTYLSVTTGAQGTACARGLKESSVRVLAAARHRLAFQKEQHNAHFDLRVNFDQGFSTSSAFCDGGWCSIPGWPHQFNPKLDSSNRTYFYMRNVSVNGTAVQPFNFGLRQGLLIEDNSGRKIYLEFVVVSPGVFLYEYNTIS